MITHCASSSIRLSSLTFHISNYPLELLNGIQQNLTGSKISTSSTKFVFFGLIEKTRWPPRPLIGWDFFDFSSETTLWNSTKLNWHLARFGRPLLSLCFSCRSGKTRLPSQPLIGWNIFVFSSETAKKLDRKQDLKRPLPSFCFSGWSEK